jgi:hypothetical protein
MNKRLIILMVATLCVGGCVVVPPQEASVEVDVAPPVVYEANVSPVVVDEYYFVDGHYYYWHPSVQSYVLLRGFPPAGFRISRMERLPYRDRDGHITERGRATERREAPEHAAPAHTAPVHTEANHNPPAHTEPAHTATQHSPPPHTAPARTVPPHVTPKPKPQPQLPPKNKASEQDKKPQ